MKPFLRRFTGWLLSLTGCAGLVTAAQGITFTTNATISSQDLTYDRQDVVVSHCTLTVDGPHTFSNLLVTAGGVLTHSFATNGTILETKSILEEPQVLTGTGEATLSNANAISASIVVQDATGTFAYAEGLDYLTFQTNGVTTLWRIPGSRIPNGAMVLVSYSVLLPGIASGLYLSLVGDLEVATGGAILSDGGGYGGGAGPGAGGSVGVGPPSGSGGGHGGYGGLSSSNAPGGGAYGNAAQPTTPGSGGGRGWAGAGGAGGGVINLGSLGTVTVNGVVSANGLNATNSRAGGGAGGSIFITAHALAGSGTISADGGRGEPIHGGGGGGGRIALIAETNQIAGVVMVRGGVGFQHGGAGTLYRRLGYFLNPQVSTTYDNGGTLGAVTPSAAAITGEMHVKGGAVVAVAANQYATSLLVESNSWLTCRAGAMAIEMTVNSNAVFAAGSGIDLRGKGYAYGQGPGAGVFNSLGLAVISGGGGGHAGYGGMGAGGYYARGGIYNDGAALPDFPGSGGGGTSPLYRGGSGGGVLRLTVTQTLQLDGSIMADGGRPAINVAGGGAGGSVRLNVGTFSGTGSISAHGGSAYQPNGGGGGSGGMIAVTFDTNLFAGTIAATGGTGFQNGAAGTVYMKANSAPIPQVRVDGGGLPATNTFLNLSTSPLVDLTVRGGARAMGLSSFNNLTLGTNGALALEVQSATLTVSSNAVLEPGAAISLDGTGYAFNAGSGAGRYYNNYSALNSGGGGGHGGFGGNGLAGPSSAAGGRGYDFVNSATLPGSGGGGSTTFPGGYGGGYLRLNVAGLLRLDGRISADGTAGTSGLPGSSGGAGGGSGGSLVLSLGELAGAGVLSANGGAGDPPNGGGGGGGRVIVTCKSNAFTGTFTARGGVGFVGGGAGTVYIKSDTSPFAQVTLDNGGLLGTNSYVNLNSTMTLDLVLRDGAIQAGVVSGSAPALFRNLFIGSNSWMFTSGNTSGDSWTISSNATIEAGGGISAAGKGYAANLGNGPGRYFGGTYNGGGGGGYGGFGGYGLPGPTSAAGGVANISGSILRPSFAGSGGGRSSSSSSSASESAGGGALNLTVTGQLRLDGTISVSGMPGMNSAGGGGSGGSLLLNVGVLAGSGVISADGGAGDLPAGGGGGGGRIGVYWGSNSFTGTLRARGGAGYQAGGAGTVYLSPIQGKQSAILFADNGGQRGTNTLVSLLSSGDDLRVSGGAVVVTSERGLTVRGLDVLTNSAIIVSNQAISVSADARIFAGAAIFTDGFGYGPASGPGAGSTSQTPKPGGSHGGMGGFNPVVTAIGSLTVPTTWGSGGANGSGSSSLAPYGGPGGGAVSVNVTGQLTVDGRVSADGSAGGLNSGGGSGGSVWLTSGTLAGTGTISANGGAGNGSAGGGGGGRVAVNFRTNLFAGSVNAFGGSGAATGGAGTAYWAQTGTTNKWLVLNNGGPAGALTPLTGVPSALDFTVANGATAFPQSTFPIFNSITIGSGGLITIYNSQSALELATLGDLTIAADGDLRVDGKGYAANAGPGKGARASWQGGGGGYGGDGGASAAGALGGTNYGSATQPLDRGSSGGTFDSLGSEGGGAIHVRVGGTLSLDGRVSADGNAGWDDDSGGGAGGSVWLTASSLAGAGAISVNGGDGELFNGGGGGGGRLAIYSPTNAFTGLVSAVGGLGANPGQPGSVFVATNLPGFEIAAHTPAGVVSNVVSAVDFTFSEMLNPNSVTGEDFLLFTPTGVLPQTNLSVAVVGFFTVRVSFPVQNAPGDYRLEVGTGIESLFGQPLAQAYAGAFAVAVPTITGSVTNAAGVGVAGVALQPDGGLPAVVTDADGRYAIGVPPGWTGNVVPALPSYLFVPAVRHSTNVVESLTNENFLIVDTIVPTLTSASDGTNLLLNWTGIPGVAYQAWRSTNLANWYPWGAEVIGTNGPMQMLVPTSDATSAFLRMRATN